MDNYQQKIDALLRKARAQGVARAAGTKKSFITNIVVTPKDGELKSLKDIWRNMDISDSKNPTSTIKSRKSTKDKKSNTKKSSSSNKNNREEFKHINMENIPFVGFRRNKSSFNLKKYKDTPQLNRKYTLLTDSPGSDQSSDTSPLKNVKKPAITNYFQRMGIKTGHTERTDTISPNFISPDIIRSNTISVETECTMVSSAFSENSSLTSDESGDVLMTSAVSSPMVLSDDDEEMCIKGEAAVFKLSGRKSDHRITPPNRNASVVGYFQKGKRQQRFTEFVTGDKLNDISPDTLRILAAAQSNGGLDRGSEMKNPFII
ncbi:hypothetical protein GLOIN_2v1672645 [Rhizophagus clarus]|uniref:Uncharacterized protein n=1 Tax=Rhizophagus clarus TaxID=94130 RepID=A0A8H3R672_9GLOM|nr:hypothetical protein GLOIN_2v1672645 [Rhizophagus clarus]